MGSIPITRSIPRQRQAGCGNRGGGKCLIAWENSWELRTNSAPDRCPRLPLIAPAFARGVALGLHLIFQVRIRGLDRRPSTHRQPPARDRVRNESSFHFRHIQGWETQFPPTGVLPTRAGAPIFLLPTCAGPKGGPSGAIRAPRIGRAVALWSSEGARGQPPGTCRCPGISLMQSLVYTCSH